MKASMYEMFSAKSDSICSTSKLENYNWFKMILIKLMIMKYLPSKHESTCW